jgi:hypothetical protein
MDKIEGVFLHPFGIEVNDKITGFRGIIVVRCQHIFGCNTYGVAPPVSDKGERKLTEYFDEGRLVKIGPGISVEEVTVDRPGSEDREHPNC